MVVSFPFRNMPFECLLSAAFLVAIGFSFPFHRQCGFIQDTIFEQVIEGAHAKIDDSFCSAYDDIWRPALGYFALNIREFFLLQYNESPSVALLILLISGIVIERHVFHFQEIDNIVNRLPRML